MKSLQQLRNSISSESIRKLNPHLFSDAGGVHRDGGKPARQETLVRRIKKSKGSVSCICEVSLIAFRRTEADDDGNISALKWLRDAIAATLGIDDGDKRVRWKYSSIVTTGKQETI